MDSSIPLKLVLAAVLGGIIGIEREIRDKPAGLRSNILICVGSTLFMSISTKVAQLLGVSAGQVYLAKHRVSRLLKRETDKLRSDSRQ